MELAGSFEEAEWSGVSKRRLHLKGQHLNSHHGFLSQQLTANKVPRLKSKFSAPDTVDTLRQSLAAGFGAAG
jgi:hypothetical protein